MPSWTAFSVVRLLEDYFAYLVQYDFTAEMENDLDRIADGEQDRVGWLNGFYFGGDKYRGLRSVIDNLGDIDAREINSITLTDDITLRIGKYGPYLEVRRSCRRAGWRTPRRVNLPPDLAPDELTPRQGAANSIDAPVVVDRVIGVNPDNGKEVVAKDGRFGPYVTELDPEARHAVETPTAEAVADTVDAATGEIVAAEAEEEAGQEGRRPSRAPRRSSSPWTWPTIDLETALRLLDLPRWSGRTPSPARTSPRRTASTVRT